MLNDLLYNVHVVYCQSNWGWPQVAYCPSRDFYTSLSRSISYFLKFDIVWLGGGESCCFFFKKTNNRFCSLLPNSFGFHFCEWVETYLNFLGVKKDAQAKKIQKYGHLCCKTDAQVWIKGKSRVCWKHFWTNHIVIWQENFFLQVIGCFSLYCWNLIWVGCLLNYCRQWYPLFASLKMILRIHGGTTARYGSDVP